MDLKLYYAPGSCSLAALVALEEAGATFEAVALDLAAGDQRSAEYLAINPRGRVPTLALDGNAIGETVAILTTLAHLFPDADLLPSSSPLALGRAYERMSWLASTAHVSIAQIWRTERFTREPAAVRGLQEDGRRNVATHFETIEGWVGDGWVLDDYSVLDPYVLVFWRWGERLGLDMSAFPGWKRHSARMLARPAVSAALAREQASVSKRTALASV
jgi:glutathione S-transferase